MAGERERERERAARIMGHWRPAGQHHVSVTRGRIIAEQTAIVNVRPIATTDWAYDQQQQPQQQLLRDDVNVYRITE